MNHGLRANAESWDEAIAQRLPVFGHRNWIVVADSAYPTQSNPGIETIRTGNDHFELLQKTLNADAKCSHVRAIVYVDAELKAVSEADAPGITEYRGALNRLLNNQDTCELEHEQIIAKFDQRSSLVRILILKSTLTIPYTSVFLELDCGCWGAEAEKRLRSALAFSSAYTA